jgi:hypothetical protein
MWVRFPVVYAALATLVGSGIVLAEGQGVHPRRRFPNYTGYAVERAIDGARLRLADRECQQVLTDFQDAFGNSLLANLTAKRRSPVEYLDELWFVDASDARPCRGDGALVAYTSPGLRIIYVCAARFVHPLFRLKDRLAELLIIHEFLHSLGLGENPPTSDQITKQVTRRCGR